MNQTSRSQHILVIDDEAHLRELYGLALGGDGYEVANAASVEEALHKLRAQRFDAVVVDMALPDGTGLRVLRWLQEQKRNERAIVVTAHGNHANSVEALKAGAFDYLAKPVELKALRRIIHSALDQQQEVPADDERERTIEALIGESAAMRAVKDAVRRVAPSMAPVLVLGPTGSGKELVARAIHALSGRPGKFVAVNCSAIPESLLEAEFFGYRKGAFTGAMRDHDGFFRAAHNGTLFLDEVAELPLAMQSKLLRALQERCVRPVGDTQERAAEARVVSATWQDLETLVARGRFRGDLFFRLDVIRLRLPPLSQRREDILPIAQALLKRLSREAGYPPLRLSPAVEQELVRMDLPGNVRELDNILQRAAAMRSGPVIDAADLSPVGGVRATDPAATTSVTATATAPNGEPATSMAGRANHSPSPGNASTFAHDTVPELDAPPQTALPAQSATWSTLPVNKVPSQPGAASWPDVDRPSSAPNVASQAEEDADDLPTDLEKYLGDVERAVLLKALRRHGFNRSATAERLGITLRQIRYRMERLGIHADEEATSAEPS